MSKLVQLGISSKSWCSCSIKLELGQAEKAAARAPPFRLPCWRARVLMNRIDLKLYRYGAQSNLLAEQPLIVEALRKAKGKELKF
eukprot:1137655-Pelagomonas_calceolata.AAC.2